MASGDTGRFYILDSEGLSVVSASPVGGINGNSKMKLSLAAMLPHQKVILATDYLSSAVSIN
jgi:hypothetical protein